jgi:hypothetical protein
VHVAEIVARELTGGALELALNVHTGTPAATGACQLTPKVAVGPAPAALAADIVYVRAPEADDVVVQVLPVLVQLVHV